MNRENSLGEGAVWFGSIAHECHHLSRRCPSQTSQLFSSYRIWEVIMIRVSEVAVSFLGHRAGIRSC